MNKYEQWYESLPEHTRAWLRSQPVWHDKDLYIAFGIGALFGFMVGLLF